MTVDKTNLLHCFLVGGPIVDVFVIFFLLLIMVKLNILILVHFHYFNIFSHFCTHLFSFYTQYKWHKMVRVIV